MKKLCILLVLLILSSCGIKKSNDFDMTELRTGSSLKDSTTYMGLHTSSPTFNQNDGTFIYQLDTIFTIGVTSRAEARIVKKLYDNVPDSIVELFHKSPNGTIKREFIKTGDIMDVNLVCLSPDVFVINKVVDEQPIDEESITEWIWGITPQKTGNYNLIMRVTIKYNNINKNKIVFDKNISVQNKPKRFFKVDIEKSSKFKNLSTRSITCTITETTEDYAQFRWGGEGKIIIEFERSSNFPYGVEGDEIINDNKKLFITKWSVTPDTKLKQVKVKINIIGNDEKMVIYQDIIPIDKNFKQKFAKFVDVTLQRWYWIFSVLLIPIYNFVKKKISPEKKLFTRKKRIVKTI